MSLIFFFAVADSPGNKHCGGASDGHCPQRARCSSPHLHFRVSAISVLKKKQQRKTSKFFILIADLNSPRTANSYQQDLKWLTLILQYRVSVTKISLLQRQCQDIHYIVSLSPDHQIWNISNFPISLNFLSLKLAICGYLSLLSHFPRELLP